MAFVNTKLYSLLKIPENLVECFVKIIRFAIKIDSLDLVKWTFYYFNSDYDVYYVSESITKKITYPAFKYNRTDILAWLNQYVFDYDDDKFDACCVAARFGHFELVKWLYSEKNIPLGYGSCVCVTAAKHGYFEICKWANENDCIFYPDDFAIAAAKSGRVDILSWGWNIYRNKEKRSNDEDADQYSIRLEDDFLVPAAKYGHLNILIWLYKHYYCFLNKDICDKSKTQVHIQNWLHQNDCSCSC